MASFLQSYKRQPKIYINLPSKGAFYNTDVIKDLKCTEMPVFGMNTYDEITIKTPDALFSGDATANVIKSCVPYVLDPWSINNFDLDFILISLRVATYGQYLTVEVSCPHCKQQSEHQVNLTALMDSFQDKPLYNTITFEGLKIQLRPLTYRETQNFSKQNFRLQQDLLTLDNYTGAEKDKKAQDIYDKFSALSFDTIISHIQDISNENNETETDLKIIKDFIIHNDLQFYSLLQDSIKKVNNEWEIKPVTVTCQHEDCKKDFPSTIDFNYSNFFVKK